VKAARLRFGALQFVESCQRRAGDHAREAVAHHLGVDEHAVFTKHVRESPAIAIEGLAVLLEPHPAMEDQLFQTIARFLRERRRGIEASTEFRRIDAEQPDAAELRDGDRVAVGDRGHHHRLGSFGPGAERNGLSNCHGRREHHGQNLHTHLRWRGIAQ